MAMHDPKEHTLTLTDPGRHALDSARQVAPPSISSSFAGTARFQVIRRLGAGGCGVVYLVHDLASMADVALKTFPLGRPELIYRLKREFRALSDLRHENLISFYELFTGDGEGYFTMEYVPGCDFLGYVRPNGILDEVRLRSALAQLCDGLSVLHAAGKVHRDVKPSNVLVNGDRVVILDFGLATELEESGFGRSVEVAGTPGYMSPEHARGEAVSPASDWYSVGVMLHQALTGKVSVSESSELAEAPPDLSRLCSALLAADPAMRPTDGEIATVIGKERAQYSREAAREDEPLVGRDAELAALDAALQRVRVGCTVTVRLEGASGTGKTALAEHFLAKVARTEGALVLRGRCYERERVPYQGIDSLVDDLCRHLRRLGAQAAAELLPTHVGALVRVFPAMETIPRAAELAARGYDSAADQQELRRRAFGALRELLARISERHRLVIHIDDLQWGDLDTAALLREVVRPPDAPGMLLILTSRAEDRERSGCLRALAEALGSALVILPVGPLSPEASVRLTRLLVRGLAAADLSRLAAEAGGSPFLLHELAAYVRGGLDSSAGVDLSAALRHRISSLPPSAAGLLEAVALAGHPIPESAALRAAGVTGSPWAAWAPLHGARLVRFFGAPGSRTVEPFHDRIRETVADSMDPARAIERHRGLADALGAVEGIEPEVVARHCAAAGKMERAGALALQAAGRAESALAFDHAARLFRWALELTPSTLKQRTRVQISLATALANAGRGEEAAKAYLIAAETTDVAACADLRRRASEQYIFSGHIDEGRALVDEELRAAGFAIAGTPLRALSSLIWNRLRLDVGGYRFHERSAPEVAPDRLALMDHLYAVARGLSLVDVIHSAELTHRFLRVALNAGEPVRIAEALALAAGHSAAEAPFSARTERLIRRFKTHLHRFGIEQLRGYAPFADCVRFVIGGAWREGLIAADDAERLFAKGETRYGWETWTTRMFSDWALYYLGRWGELEIRVARNVEEAVDRGNVYAYALTVAPWGIMPMIARGDVDGARRHVSNAAARWAASEFHLEHYWFAAAESLFDLHARRGHAAWERLVQRWPGIVASLVFRVPLLRMQMFQLRGACALAAASRLARNGDRSHLHAEALRSIRSLRRNPLQPAHAFADLLEAALAWQQGREVDACTLLGSAVAGFDRDQMAACSACARLRLAQLRGERAPDEFMPGERVAAPAAIADMLAPGFGATA